MIATTLLGISLLSLGFVHSIPSFPFRYAERDLTKDGSFGIINGTETDIRKHPYQAAVYLDRYFYSSGAIIDKNWILTTVLLPSLRPYITVGVGSTKVSKIDKKLNVTKIILHPDFSSGTEYWLSLVKLAKPLKFSKYIMKINIASQTPRNQSSAVVSGWGAISFSNFSTNDVLRQAKLSILDKVTCNSAYISSDYRSSVVSNTTFCGLLNNYTTLFMGDRGDPLVQGKKLVGSFLYYTGSPRYCNDPPNCPSIFTDVTQFGSWIKNVIKNE